MKIEQLNKKDLKTSLKVILDKEYVKKEYIKLIEKNSSSYKKPGFRNGKVPLKIVENDLGVQLFQDNIKTCINDSIQKIIKDKNYKLASKPKCELNVCEKDKDIEYTLTIEEMPDIPLYDLKSIKVDEVKAIVTKNDIDDYIEQIKKENFIPELVKSVEIKKEYLITMDYKVFDSNKNLIDKVDGFRYEFDSANFPAKLKDKIHSYQYQYGKKNILIEIIDDKKYEILIKAVFIKKKISTISEVAKSYGFEKVEDFKDYISRELDNKYLQLSQEQVLTKIYNELAAKVDFCIPPSMLEEEMAKLKSDIKSKDDEKKHKDILTKKIKLGLILSEIAQVNKIFVSNDDIIAEINKNVSQFPEKERKQVEDYYKKNSQATVALSNKMLENKIIGFLKSKIKINTKQEPVERFLKMLNKKIA